MTRISILTAELRNVARQATATWSFLRPMQRVALMSAVLLMAGTGYLTAFIPLSLGNLVDGILAGRLPSMAACVPILAALAGAYLLREVLQVVRKIIVEGTATTVERNATVAAVSGILRSDLSALTEQAGSINGRLSRSVSGLVKLLKLSFLDLFPALFGAVFAVAAAVLKNPAMGLLMAAVIPVGLTVILFQLASQRGVRLELMRVRERMDGTVVEQLGGIEAVRAADTLDLELSKVRKAADRLRAREYRHHIDMSLFDAGKSLNEGLFHIAVVVAALGLALSGRASAGDVLAFSILFMAIVNPLREVHRIIDESHESALRVEDFFEITTRPVDISFEGTFSRPDVERSELIEFINVEVSYPGEGNNRPRPVLRDFTMTIRRGEKIGFAGPSGSGKTTLIRTLLRLAHPTSGAIRIGGVDSRNISRASIGSIFGLISQTPFLFTGTVAENIAYGSPSPSAEAIRRAAGLARIEAEIDALPGGFDAMISERGLNLSGGQRQRIALARIFLQDPPILILDEATSALDNTNERHVMEAVSRAVEGRTVLMVAHRLSTLKHADRIVVLKNGRLVEQGSYADLAAIAGGVFAGLTDGTSYGAAA